jgi:hypothetical protein
LSFGWFCCSRYTKVEVLLRNRFPPLFDVFRQHRQETAPPH